MRNSPQPALNRSVRMPPMVRSSYEVAVDGMINYQLGLPRTRSRQAADNPILETLWLIHRAKWPLRARAEHAVNETRDSARQSRLTISTARSNPSCKSPRQGGYQGC